MIFGLVMATDQPEKIRRPALRPADFGVPKMIRFLSRLVRRPRLDAPGWIGIVDLQRRLAAGDALVLVDVRQPEEFTLRLLVIWDSLE